MYNEYFEPVKASLVWYCCACSVHCTLNVWRETNLRHIAISKKVFRLGDNFPALEQVDLSLSHMPEWRYIDYSYSTHFADPELSLKVKCLFQQAVDCVLQRDHILFIGNYIPREDHYHYYSRSFNKSHTESYMHELINFQSNHKNIPCIKEQHSKTRH